MALNKLVETIKEILKKIPQMFSMLKGLSPKKIFARKDRKSEGLTADGPPVHDKRKLGGIFSAISEKLGDSFHRLTGGFGSSEAGSGFMASMENRFLHSFPEKKRRPILFGFFGMFVLFLILLISIPITFSGRDKESPASDNTVGFTIPADELFFPSEPDFLPEFLLERQPKGLWSFEDIRPYWRVPENSELWRDQVRSAVERLMENIP